MNLTIQSSVNLSRKPTKFSCKVLVLERNEKAQQMPTCESSKQLHLIAEVNLRNSMMIQKIIATEGEDDQSSHQLEVQKTDSNPNSIPLPKLRTKHDSGPVSINNFALPSFTININELELSVGYDGIASYTTQVPPTTLLSPRPW
jgi:hypothetical protein